MNAKDLVLDDCSEGEIIEDLCAVSPDIEGTELAQTLIVESVHLRDLSRLVIPADQRYPIRVPHLLNTHE